MGEPGVAPRPDSLPFVLSLCEMRGEVHEQRVDRRPLGVRELAERLRARRVPLVRRLEGEDREPAAAVELCDQDPEQVLERHVTGLRATDVAEPPGLAVAVLDHGYDSRPSEAQEKGGLFLDHW